MKSIVRVEAAAAIAVIGAALAGCGAASGSDGSEPPAPGQAATETTTAAVPSIAEAVVAANAKADADLHIVARKYLNNGTEVAEFYEPLPGHIIFSAAGSPSGPSVIAPLVHRATTAREMWAAVAPGEAVPQKLAEAIARSRTPVSKEEIADIASEEPPAVTRSAGKGGPAPAATPKPSSRLHPDGTGYCATGFWSDYSGIAGPNGTNGPDAVAETLNWGYNYNGWSDVTRWSGYAVCPQGDVSGTGGLFEIDFPTLTTSWEIAPNYYRYEDEFAGHNCGWQFSCWDQAYAYQCTPTAMSVYGEYWSDCYRTYGTSCGDDYDWVAAVSFQGPWCSNSD